MTVTGNGTSKIQRNLKQRNVFVKCSILLKSKTFSRAALLALFSLLSLSLPSCGPLSDLESGFTSLFQIPFSGSDGQYSLQKIEIKSFDDPTSLHGQYARILVDPYESGGGIESSKPVGRFARTRDGVMVPLDYVTMLATSIHAHMERLHALNAEVGLNDAQVGWPATVGIEANVVNSKKKETVRNNALFEKRLNALLMVPYSDKDLPIGLNGGILAHEHFHRIFQALVLSKVETKEEAPVGSVREFNETVLRAMNEGFADFWAWVYTGDAEFMRASLPREAVRRTLKVRASRICSTDEVRDQIVPGRFESSEQRETMRIDVAYRMGTRYARMLRELARDGSREARVDMARALVKSLPMLAEVAVQARDKEESLNPMAFLKPLTLQLPPPNAQQADVLARVKAQPTGALGEECAR